MMDLDTHALNKVLADTMKMQLHASANGDYWLMVDDDENELLEWNPCRGHNQAALVEAALVAEKRELKYVRDLTLHEWLVWISAPGMFLPPAAPIKGRHDNKLIAFALAVEAMLTDRQEGAG